MDERCGTIMVGIVCDTRTRRFVCFGRYSDFSFVIFVPSSVTPAINPLFVSMNRGSGWVCPQTIQYVSPPLPDIQ
ncbi:hypothetical protein [Paraburkholderia elongata]|uniref:Uncharacterized protein n=1 Tax=Paraburkholderia elongata TaxID=2675747 RepID=A0A972NPW2_9BURK|nr:hypothetical protein [Paraburkholderia elongata]NPT56842.1 hypothetical protein [Paraburkholderia elongata]